VRRVLVVGVLAALLLAASVHAAAAAAPLTVSTCAGQRMDVYPAHSETAVLYVHGGAWVSGSRQDTGDLFPELLPRLRQAGVTVAAADYRLAPRSRWPDPLNDVTCAINYLRSHLGAQRIRLYGTSAGGQIVSVLGLERTPAVDRVVDMYGPADLRAPGWSPWLAADVRREFGDADPSPVDLVTPGAPPFLVVQGACDQVVPASQSRELVAALRRGGDRVDYVEVPGAGHGLWACHGSGRPAAVRDVVAEIAAFLTAAA
jgi:acetyl esterase/lipase